jgi:hypothetical protein
VIKATILSNSQPLRGAGADPASAFRLNGVVRVGTMRADCGYAVIGLQVA